jgi:Zn-dependent peptidase ImmA (M78 family)
MELKEALGNIYNTAKQEFGIENTPKLYLRQDTENAQNLLGKTAYYEPEDQSIIIFITNRHPKDICRSFAHELIHHVQNERGDLERGDASQATYAQDDPHMRKIEMEAYLKGNMLFRDWEDKIKNK